MNEKVLKYEEFLNEKLRTDLRIVHEQRDKLYKEINEYMQVKRLIETLKGQKEHNNTDDKKSPDKCTAKMKMDLGCNFYCQTLIPDCSRIYLLVGYGYFVEMTLEEADNFIDKKLKILKDKSQLCSKDSAKIKAHIKLVMGGLRELQNLNFGNEKPKIDVFL
ncbi:protein UXT homolog [Clytia hemisphaerica]